MELIAAICLIIINILGYFYLIKIIIDFVRNGWMPQEVETVLSRLSLFEKYNLCFGGSALAVFLMTGNKLQLLYFIIHAASFILTHVSARKIRQGK